MAASNTQAEFSGDHNMTLGQEFVERTLIENSLRDYLEAVWRVA